MSSAIPGRTERSMRSGEVFGRTGPDALGTVGSPTSTPIRVAESPAAPGIDACRLVVAAAGLSAGLVLPGALLDRKSVV